MDTTTIRKIQMVELDILKEIHRICVENNLTYYLVEGTLLGAIRHHGFIPWDEDMDIAMPRRDYNRFVKIFNKNAKDGYSLHYFGNVPGYWLPILKVRKSGTIMKEKIQERFPSESGIWVDIFPLDNATKQQSKMQEFQKKCYASVRSFLDAKCGVYDISERTFFTRTVYSMFKHFSNGTILSFCDKIMSWNKNNNSKFYFNFGSSYDYVKETIPKDKFYPPKKCKFEDAEFYIMNDPKYFLNRIYGDDYMELPPVEKRGCKHSIIELSFDGINYEKI